MTRPFKNPPKGCFEPGCPRLTYSTYCSVHQAEHSQQYDLKRGSPTKRGYNYRWTKESKAYLQRNPLCVSCLKEDVIRSATEVDHVKPHQGNMKLFWNVSNWQALCKSCHSAKTSKERTG